MMQDILTRLARRTADPQYDPRHAVLDIAPELLSLEASLESLPEAVQFEFRELLREVRKVQPAFPSRRLTSSLFDREGMGQVGRERASRLVQRLRALAAAIESLSGHS